MTVRVRLMVVALCAITLAQLPLQTNSAEAAQGNNDNVEQTVRSVFADTPVLIDIARCESRFRQFDKRGNPLDGGSGSMIGVYQINARVHSPIAESMGIDIYSLAGNMAYAKHLYDEKGTDPWLSSFKCWHASESASTGKKSSVLVLGMEHDDVRSVQQMLNGAGFYVATEGPGSPGQETRLFGTQTRAALRKFQCAQGIACNGNEHSTGYGSVGVRTLAVLKELSNVNPSQDAPELAVAASAPQSHSAAAAAALILNAATASVSTSTTNDDPAAISHLEALIQVLTARLTELLRERNAQII